MGSDEGVRRITRREMLKIVGVSGLGLAAAASGAGRMLPVSAASLDPQDEAPEGFLAWAFNQRARAQTTKDVKLLDALYDPASAQLLAFEKDRAAFMNDLGTRWNGKLLEYGSLVSLLELQRAGAVATARIYEVTGMHWIPSPRPVSSEEEALRKKHPEKCITSPRGPKGEISSAIGTRHELVLEKSAKGWRLVQDSYEEPEFFGTSPNIKPGSWSAVVTGKPSNSDFKLKSPAGPPPPEAVIAGVQCTTRSWYPADAVNYANNRCNNYNTSFCNYNSCGGDCGNFVSQCLWMGNQVMDGSWYTFNGACGNCGTSSVNAGTDIWANSWKVRTWVIDAGRGVDKNSINDILAGDLVNYYYDSAWRHVAIMTDGLNKLVSAHNSDVCNVDWHLGYSTFEYTWINTSYCA